MSKAPATLEICVTDTVCFGPDFTAPSAVEPVLSPFFQPEYVFTIDEGGEGTAGNPNGPGMTIELVLSEALLS